MDYFFPIKQHLPDKKHKGTSCEGTPCWGVQAHGTLSQKNPYSFKTVLNGHTYLLFQEKLSIEQPLPFNLNSRELIGAGNLPVINQGN